MWGSLANKVYKSKAPVSQLVNAEVNIVNCNITRGQHAGMNCCSMHLYSDKATVSTNQHTRYIATL